MLHNLLCKVIFDQDYPNLGRLCNMLRPNRYPALHESTPSFPPYSHTACCRCPCGSCVVTWSKIRTQRIVFSSQVVCQDVPTCNLDTTECWFLGKFTPVRRLRGTGCTRTRRRWGDPWKRCWRAARLGPSR